MAVQVLVLKERAAGAPCGRDAGNGQETGRARCRRVDRAGAGRASSMHDAVYLQAGAQPACAGAMAQAEMVLCVQAPSTDTLLCCKPHPAVIGMRWRRTRIRRAQAFTARQSIAFPLERLPRSPRAQSIDVLRSQAGMAGDKVVLSAA
ncbi:NAD/NADP transhydrogenase alpha subunit (fragment) [Xanthomonas phaseoli pv. phaseoli]|uniref:proton-translocating NAD(P)(+) transhydrogenase n=2 Tax=Xanthomonas TaxID=338 RepID=A0AB38E022_XANCH